jgi:lysophospholipase L1-like esterase
MLSGLLSQVCRFHHPCLVSRKSAGLARTGLFPLRRHTAAKIRGEYLSMVLDMLRSFCRIAGCLAAALAVAGCGGDSAPSPAAGVAVVDVPPPPVSAPAPAPAPAATPAPASPPAADSRATTAVIVQSGDSIGVGVGAGDWAAINHLGFASSVAIHNVSVSGITMQAGYGQRAVELFPFQNNQAPSVLLIQQGSNDLYHGTKADILYRSVLMPFVSSAKAAGFYVVVNTVLPRTDDGWSPASEQQRVSYNTMVRTNTAGADVINDVAADALIGDSTNPSVSPFYADKVHPSLAGQERLAALNAAVLSRFLQLPPRTRQ